MKKWNYFLASAIGVSLILGGTTGFAKSVTEKISVRFSNIKLIVNGNTINTKAEPFSYNGNVYAPVATIANMLGVHQEWDNNVPAVRFSSSPIGPGETKYGVNKPMGNGVYLLDNIESIGQYTLDDKGKRTDIPHTGDTVITEVTSFLYLTAFGYPHDFLVIEKDRKNQSIVYLNVYNYHQGKLTKVTSMKSVATRSDIVMHVAHEKGWHVYISEHQNGELISTLAYEWDERTNTYKKTGVLSK